MSDRFTSDMSFWMKFLREANLTETNQRLLELSLTLANNFQNLEQLINSNENQLKQLGFVNQTDRKRLIEHAQRSNSTQLKRRSTMATRVIESWLGDEQATPLNPNGLSKSTCNLSPSLLSRISFNERPASVIYPFAEPKNDIRKRNFGHLLEPQEKVTTIDDQGRIQISRPLLSSSSAMTLDYQGVLKKTPSKSIQSLRTLKSLSDTISIQKKTPTGVDRLKRLDSTTSLFQRQTSFISKKVSTLATKFVNPFANLKKKNETNSTQRQCFLVEEEKPTNSTIGRTVTIMSNNKRTRENDDEQPQEKRKVQILSVNNEIRRQPTGIFSYEEKSQQIHPVQTLGSKRFKLGATTSFLTRSLANHGLME